MLKIKTCLVILFVVSISTLNAQTKIQIQGTSPSLYLIHTVAAKENWYSIGRIYNQSPKEIAPFNNTAMDKSLAIGQKIKIPLTAINFSQDGKRSGDEVFVPLYHTVQDKEWMFRISTIYNKVPVETIEKWNSIHNDQLKSGMQLVVGYLKVKEAQSALAANGSSTIKVVTAPPVVVKEIKPVEETEKKVPSGMAKVEPIKAEIKEEPAKPDEQEQPKKEEIKTTEVQPVSVSGPANHKGGAFKKIYGETGNATTGNAGIFRSTSGWNDGKYYALMNNVPVGTIVKVSFSSTNKSVYAKVLGQLPEMKESQGLTLRISDAAASELGVSLNKFYVDVKY